MKTIGPEFLTAHRETGEPLEGVIAELYESKYNRLLRRHDLKRIGTATSDELGFVRPQVAERQYFQVKFKQGDDQLFIRDGYSNYSYNNRRQKHRTTHFFLDRAIYRPGQTVYFQRHCN